MKLQVNNIINHLAVYFIKCLYVLFMAALCSTFSTSLFAQTAQALFEQGQVASQRGDFEPAIRHWQAALKTDDLDTQLHANILIQLATAYQALGLSDPARETLLQALPLSDNNPLLQATVLTNLSDLSLATRQDTQAHDYAYKSLEILPKEAPASIRATLLNNLGNVQTVEAYYAKAIETYTDSIKLAQTVGNPLLPAKTLINLAYAYSKTEQWQAATNSLEKALQQLEAIDHNSYDKTFSLLSVGAWAQRLDSQAPATDAKANRQKPKAIALTALNKALKLAKQLENSRLLSYAYGYLGQLYETEQRYADSLQLTRQAIFFAQKDQTSFFTQQNQASEILYRWQWQLGRLFKATHQIDQAIESYRNAVNSHQPVRWELAIGYRKSSQSFRDTVGPVYFELADLLLQRAATATNKDKEHWLKEAQNTIERLKTVELQDYFRDECVTEFQAKRTPLDTGIAQTAVLYPILLPDRTEILLSLPNEIQQFTIPITATRLKDEVNEFRFELESNDSDNYLAYAQRLYQWLITPLESALKTQQVETLIIVPDGVLRTIPFAALHDGKQFLIAKYAVAITPGLTLTEAPKPLPKHHLKVLVSGLSENVEGYSKLLSVKKEVNFISNLYPQGVTLLLDQTFTVDKFAEELKKTVYAIVHIASHGQFDSNPQKTFILTYDGKLTMNRLEQLIRLSEIRQEPMELLTLSACQTAVGDDQAALGLAGIAVKAGARSALASLWFIDDEATSQLMGNFYHQLQQEGTSKAKALQFAQKQLLKQPRYQHPAFWAPFLLIGNWL